MLGCVYLKEGFRLRRKYVVPILGLLSLFMMWKFYNILISESIHKSVNPEQVFSIELWGEKYVSRTANNEETAKIIEWFNSATDIRENKEFAGTTPEAGIVIKLKSRQTILVIRSGTDFEIQRNDIGKRVSYWAKQSNLRKLLEQLAKEERPVVFNTDNSKVTEKDFENSQIKRLVENALEIQYQEGKKNLNKVYTTEFIKNIGDKFYKQKLRPYKVVNDYIGTIINRTQF